MSKHGPVYYVTGFTFNNIYGGQTEDYSRSIQQIKRLAPGANPWANRWKLGQWNLADHRGSLGYFDTLREAKARAQELWPGCGFKSSTQFRREYDREDNS